MKIEATCVNPDCELTTIVTEYPATLDEPADRDRDTCECGELLDFEDAEPVDPTDVFELADRAYEMERDR